MRLLLLSTRQAQASAGMDGIVSGMEASRADSAAVYLEEGVDGRVGVSAQDLFGCKPQI